MSYKNDEELKAAQNKWKSSALQQRNPAGYERHLASVRAYNAAQNADSSDKSKSDDKKKDKKKESKYKWQPDKDEKAVHKKNIADTEAAIKAVKEYKPVKIEGIKQKEYKNDLPARPSVPKLPKLDVPGGGLKISKVKNPSGLSGTINKYSPRSNYSNAYPNALPKKKGKKK